MSGAAYPPELLAIIASAAGGSFITNPMPLAPTGTRAASIEGGYPPVTMIPELSGGQPPLGQDVNGFNYLLSAHTFFLQAGQPYQYNADVEAAISGYAQGASLGMSDNTGIWFNTTAGNSSDPDTGGAGWVPQFAYGIANVSGLTGGTVTLTAAQSKYGVIQLSGTLTSNLIVNLPPNLQDWLIINNTTGAFNTTVQTSGAGSSGVSIPQGGPSSPIGVYSIGDGNIYPSTAPLSVPISQAATPLTLVERTSAAYVLAAYFNQSSGLETPTIGSVFVQNSAADGFLRKISSTNFISQLALITSTSLASTLTAYARLNGAAFTAAVTGVTAPTNDNTTKFATTAWVQGFAKAQFGTGASGSCTLPGGFILKWGTVAQTVATNQNHAFPAAFPNDCFFVLAAPSDTTAVEFFGVVNSGTLANQFEFYANNTCNVNYIAIGN